MTTPATNATNAPAPDAAAIAADAAVVDGAKAKLDFKARVGAEIPPDVKAKLDEAVARIKSVDAAAIAAETVETTQASPVKPKPAAAPAPAQPAPADKPPEVASATPQQIIETSKAQAREAHKLRERAQALAPKEKRVEEFEKLLPLIKTDPEAFCEALGVISWADMVRTAAAKRQGKPAPAPTSDQAVKTLEARTAALEKQTADRAAAAEQAKYDADVAAYKGTIAQDVTAAGDELELCAKEGQTAIDAIFFLQDLHFKENGAPLSIREAALQIEASLEKRYAPIASAKKFQPKAPPVVPAADPKAAAPKAPSAPVSGQKASPTLTSKQVPTTAAAQPAEPPENETDDERLRRIASKHMPKLFPGAQS